MAASCVLVTNPSSSGPTLALHNIDSSNGTGSPEGVVFRKTADWISGGLLLWKVLLDVRSFTRRPQCGVITRTEGGGLRVVIPGSGCTPTFPPRRAMFPRPWDVFIPGLGGGAPSPSSGQNAGVSTAPSSPPFLPRPPPPLPLSVASSKDALSISGTPGVNLVEEQGGREWREEVEVKRGEGREKKGRRVSTWLEGRKIISAGRLCLRLKPHLHFKSGGRPCCHLRDAIGPTSVSFNVSRHRGLDEINRAGPWLITAPLVKRRRHDRLPQAQVSTAALSKIPSAAQSWSPSGVSSERDHPLLSAGRTMWGIIGCFLGNQGNLSCWITYRRWSAFA